MSTVSDPRRGHTPVALYAGHKSVAAPRVCVTRIPLLIAAVTIALMRGLSAQNVDPELARVLERALLEAENFRKEMQTSEYEAQMHVQEWDGRGHLRGTATAHAIMRPGDPRPMTFISREVHGKVRLPDDKDESKKEKEENTSLQEFAREHQIAERFAFEANGFEQIAGERARRISFQPKPNQPERNTADRFLDTITGTVWISDENKLLKFELQLIRPFQLFWIFAVLKELSIRYELIQAGQILGHAKLQVTFAMTTPIYSIRQLHDVDLDNFRRRQAVATR